MNENNSTTKKITCPKCGANISEDVNFCPKCGANLLEVAEEIWICKNCDTENSADSLFCVTCGESREKQKSLLYSPKFRFIIALIAVILIGGLGSYFYFNSLNEDKYLTYYVSAAHDIHDVETTMESQLKVTTIKATKPEDLVTQLNAQKKILDGQLKIFSETKPFKNYDKQHNDLISILQKEIAVVDQALILLENPLDATTDGTLESMKKNLETVKDLSAQIKIPNADFSPDEDFILMPDQLKIYVDEQKKIYAEKTEKLATNKEFFRQMDEAINRYNAAKTDLEKNA